jgi:hypothetical protein
MARVKHIRLIAPAVLLFSLLAAMTCSVSVAATPSLSTVLGAMSVMSQPPASAPSPHLQAIVDRLDTKWGKGFGGGPSTLRLLQGAIGPSNDYLYALEPAGPGGELCMIRVNATEAGGVCGSSSPRGFLCLKSGETNGATIVACLVADDVRSVSINAGSDVVTPSVTNNSIAVALLAPKPLLAITFTHDNGTTFTAHFRGLQ